MFVPPSPLSPAHSVSLAHADSFLNVTKNVAEKELSKAYRKRSLELQCVAAILEGGREGEGQAN